LTGHDPMNSGKINKIYQTRHSIFLCLILTLLIVFSHSYAQQDAKSSLLKIAMSVHVENIMIRSDSIIEGLKPNFPYPILTTISIIDNQGNFITDLADTSRWLGPDDIAQIGLPISEIWDPILEYHQANPNIPKNPDLYDQFPALQIKELRRDAHIPTSTMLVMDVSTSMSEKLENAKAGAKLYIEQLRPVDRAGLVLFNHEIVKLQKFTNNKDQLIQTIDEADTDFGTVIYDAIMAAIQETKFEKSRPRIIVYTDGVDNNSDYSSNAVIDSAQTYNIPIHTISLAGGYTVEDTLKHIAAKTGGLFFRADSASQMQNIYSKLSDLIQHFYVMAHISPDPIRNDTWRTVDLTVNAPDSTGNIVIGRGIGHYFIRGSTPDQSSDIAVDLGSITDTTFVEVDDTLNAVFPGQEYSYVITVKNIGTSKANYVKLTYTLPDSVQFLNASTPFAFDQDDTYTWQFFEFENNKEIDIILNVKLASKMPVELNELTCSVESMADNDYNSNNNFDEETVHLLFRVPSQNYDLSLSYQAVTDSIFVSGNNSMPIVLQQVPFKYNLMLENLGPKTAHNFYVWSTFPDLVEIIDFNLPPTKQGGDTLFWQFDSLAASDGFSITLHAEVVDSFPSNLFPLTSISRVIADKDTFEQNNNDTTTVYAIENPYLKYDLSLTQNVVTDSAVIVDNNPVHVVYPGETLKYVLSVENLGPGTAYNVTLKDVLPDSIAIVRFNFEPVKQSSDTLFWQIDSLPAGEIFTISFDAIAADSFSRTPYVLINEGWVFGDNDEVAQNNYAVTTVYVISNLNKQPLVNVDISVSQTALTDSFSIVDGDTMRFAREGETYEYHLTVLNAGIETAQSVRVVNFFLDSVSAGNFQPTPEIISPDSAVWYFDHLALLSWKTIKFDVTVSQDMPVGKNILINQVQAFARNEDPALFTNNVAIDTVFNAVKPPSDYASYNSNAPHC